MGVDTKKTRPDSAPKVRKPPVTLGGGGLEIPHDDCPERTTLRAPDSKAVMGEPASLIVVAGEPQLVVGGRSISEFSGLDEKIRDCLQHGGTYVGKVVDVSRGRLKATLSKIGG